VLADELDLTDFDANQFSIVPDDKPDKVPNNLTHAELDEMKRAWDCMNRGTGMLLQGAASDFRRMLLDCMATSKVLRERFLALACDAANTVTFDLGRNQHGIRVDAFRFEASNADAAMRANRFGFHTIDLDDFDKLPRVAGQVPLFKQTRSQKLIHALTEAREGVLIRRRTPTTPPTRPRSTRRIATVTSKVCGATAAMSTRSTWATTGRIISSAMETTCSSRLGTGATAGQSRRSTTLRPRHERGG
jgi:hypothetical protein